MIELQTVSEHNHSCKLQLYITVCDKNWPKLLDFCSSVSFSQAGIQLSCLQLYSSSCSNAYQNGDFIQQFSSINLNEKTSSLPSIHHIVCCMLNCNCCGLTVLSFLIFWESFFINCAEQIVMTFFKRCSGTVHKNSMRHSNKGFIEFNQIKMKLTFFQKAIILYTEISFLQSH